MPYPHQKYYRLSKPVLPHFQLGGVHRLFEGMSHALPIPAKLLCPNPTLGMIIQRVSQTTGATVEQVSRLNEIFKRFGLDSNDLRDVLNEINIKLIDARDSGPDAGFPVHYQHSF